MAVYSIKPTIQMWVTVPLLGLGWCLNQYRLWPVSYIVSHGHITDQSRPLTIITLCIIYMPTGMYLNVLVSYGRPLSLINSWNPGKNTCDANKTWHPRFCRQIPMDCYKAVLLMPKHVGVWMVEMPIGYQRRVTAPLRQFLHLR